MCTSPGAHAERGKRRCASWKGQTPPAGDRDLASICLLVPRPHFLGVESLFATAESSPFGIESAHWNWLSEKADDVRPVFRSVGRVVGLIPTSGVIR
jgi:hypothetical protein